MPQVRTPAVRVCDRASAHPATNQRPFPYDTETPPAFRIIPEMERRRLTN